MFLFAEQQASVRSLNENRIKPIEKENFFKAALLEDIVSCSLKDVMNVELDRSYVSFADFINLHQHEIYHMCYSNICCLCTGESRKPCRNILDASHLRQIFDYDCRLPCHKEDENLYCCCIAKKNVSIATIDSYLTCVLLLNTCNNVFWHFCLDLQSVTIEELLNKNKHKLYHLWHGNTSCCQCNAVHINKRRKEELSRDDWKKLFNGRAQSCVLHNIIKTDSETICCVKASRNIQIQEFRHELQKIILDNVCPVKDEIKSVMEDLIDLYEYSKNGFISRGEFNDLYGNLLHFITNITILTEKNYRAQISSISGRRFDEKTYKSVLLIFQKRYISLKNLHLVCFFYKIIMNNKC